MSALYKSGTVTVTNGSNIVTGSGTSFISIAGIVPGALFTINGVNWYEVYEVNTNAQIKVRTIPAGQTFQQATASGQDYAIFQNFTSLSPTEIAARVVAIQQKWHIREEEMTDWFASTNDFEEITNINGDKITVMTPFGVNNLLGTAATFDVTTSRADTNESRLMRVSDFGLGEKVATDYPNDNFDDATVPCGFYRLINGNPSSGTRPTGLSPFAYCQVQTYDVNSKLQTVVDVSGKRAHRVIASSNPNEWVYDYNSGNSVNPLDYGLGGNTSNFLSANPDMLADLDTGFYRTFSSTTGMQSISGDTVIASKYDTNNNGRRLLLARDSIRFKSQNTNGTWREEQELYHTGNVNLNEFGGAGAHSVIATGVGRTNSEILFYLPINSYTEPTGISVNVGFNVRGKNNIEIGNENLMLSNTFSGTLSSTRYCALIVGGLVNINVGQTYRLQTVNNLSKLIVNF